MGKKAPEGTVVVHSSLGNPNDNSIVTTVKAERTTVNGNTRVDH